MSSWAQNNTKKFRVAKISKNNPHSWHAAGLLCYISAASEK